ncbi:hypothetical protein ABZP36_021543 [Zizania latifolia]
MQLQQLKARAQDVSDRRSRYGVVLKKPALQGAGTRPTKHASHHLDPQLHALFTEEAQLVGIDGPRDELVRLVMEEEPRQRVLAIIGFGGLGKTTLARMVCENPMVKGADFQCCPLFIVSQTFNIRTLFQYMIRELILRPNKAMAVAGGKHDYIMEGSFDRMERWEVEVLADKLRQYLQDKRKTNVCKLPRELGNLKHLETLDIRATLIKKLPASASNLICLKHLLVGHKVQLTRTTGVKYFRPDSGLAMTSGMLKNMMDLRSLAHVEVKEQSSVLREIGQLQKLRKLNVLFRGVEENWEAFRESLGKLTGCLRSLSIHIRKEKEHSSSLDSLAFIESPPLFITALNLTGKLTKLPPWISSLRNVIKVTLRNTGLHAEAIGILGDLPNLLCLKLYRWSYADDRITFPHGKFMRVNLLIIDNLESIEKVHFEEGSVPDLERLTLSFQREPKDGISGLENLLKLKEIEFFGHIILSLVTKVASCMKAHPNHPRVIGDKWNIVTEYT